MIICHVYILKINDNIKNIYSHLIKYVEFRINFTKQEFIRNFEKKSCTIKYF